MPDNNNNQPDNQSLQKATTPPFRILSLDGGGAKGVYTLGVLLEVERLTGRPLCETFNLMYGTSTGSIITALLGLGYRVQQIRDLYFSLVPQVMRRKSASGRTEVLKKEANHLFKKKGFNDFKTMVGIVCTNNDLQKPMVFKNSVTQAHGRNASFKPGFGCTIAEAVIASCAAYPFFEIVKVNTTNQGDVHLMDGGYVANNPTLFALADSREALKKSPSEVAVLSVGVGQYNEPQKSFFHKVLFSLWPFRHMARMFTTSSNTIDQLRTLLFPEVPCVRINEAYPDQRYATDLLEDDEGKLMALQNLGRESFAKFESDIKAKLQL